jgi:hypothetical protein
MSVRGRKGRPTDIGNHRRNPPGFHAGSPTHQQALSIVKLSTAAQG